MMCVCTHSTTTTNNDQVTTDQTRSKGNRARCRVRDGIPRRSTAADARVRTTPTPRKNTSSIFVSPFARIESSCLRAVRSARRATRPGAMRDRMRGKIETIDYAAADANRRAPGGAARACDEGCFRRDVCARGGARGRSRRGASRRIVMLVVGIRSFVD